MTSLDGAQELLGQTVVVIGGSSGIGLATARLARARGADVVLTARDDGKLRSVADEVGAREFAAFDIADFDRLQRFFDDLEGSVDHVLVTGPGPYYSSLADMDFARARQQVGRPAADSARGRDAPRPRRCRRGGRSPSWAGRAAAAQASGRP